MEHAFSNRLLLLPLFQGFSRLDFLDIVEKTPFDFRSLRPRDILVRQGEESTALCILLGGEVESEVDSPEHSYRLTEEMKAPWMIQQECLFGLHNRYARTVRARSEAQVVMLDKQSVRRLLTDYPAFQINFYNALSTYAQQSAQLLWLKRAESVEGRFRHFLQRRCLRPIGRKTLHIRMEDLASELGTTRLHVSQMLSELAARDVLTYTRGIIRIEALEKL